MYHWQKGKHLNNGKYVVEEWLGSGGYGVTHKVRNTNTNDLFAIKTLNDRLLQQPNCEQSKIKFINEIIALAKCSHPNIVRVYPQVFSENESLCMVMDYVEGKDLAEWLHTRGKFSEPDAIKIITQVGAALAYVHDLGFLHRDIKPANILLKQANLSPVLIDFGLAREYRAGSLVSMTNAKTGGFAPIEQYQRNGYFGTWTDVHALAATLYALVTGESPLPSIYREYAALKTPRQHNPNISERTNKAILAGMALEPENRPQSVGEWLKLLQPVSSFPYVKPNPSISPPITISPLTKIQHPPDDTEQQKLREIQSKIKERVANLEPTNNNCDPCLKLKNLLDNQQWQEADRETMQIFLHLTKRTKFGSLREKDIFSIPSAIVLKIDLLWLEASNNHFGLAIQRHLWQNQLGLELAPKQLRNSENLRDFGRLLGWYKEDQLIKNRDRYRFSLDAPQGHLPSLRFPCSESPDTNWWQSWKRILSSFLIQTDKCLLN